MQQVVGYWKCCGPSAPLGRTAAHDPGCVKTLRGITAPGILGPMVMRRAKKRKNLSSARHYDQIRFRFRTAKTLTGHKRCRIGDGAFALCTRSKPLSTSARVWYLARSLAWS